MILSVEMIWMIDFTAGVEMINYLVMVVMTYLMVELAMMS